VTVSPRGSPRYRARNGHAVTARLILVGLRILISSFRPKVINTWVPLADRWRPSRCVAVRRCRRPRCRRRCQRG